MLSKTTSSPASIPLNCVDKCLLALDGIDEPMILYGIVRMQGEVDADRLSRAITIAQGVHPVMRTILRTRRLRPVREIQEDTGTGMLTVADLAHLKVSDRDGYIAGWMNLPMDLRTGFPFRILLLRESETESSLVFAVHHYSADGLRALIFVRTVVEAYNSQIGSDGQAEAPPPAAAEEMRIDRKGDELLEFAHSQRVKVDHYYRRVLFSLFHRFVLSTLALPTRVFHDRSGRSRELRFCFSAIDPGELGCIQARARLAGATLNDLLLAACYRVVEKWNRMHGKSSNRIRIMAPVNISPRGFSGVVSNQASWLSLSTTPDDRADATSLLKKVRSETSEAAANRMAFALVYYFYFCSRFPLFIMELMCRFLMITRTYVDTIVLTNIGSVWAEPRSEEATVSTMGDARILNVIGSAPVVSPMGLSIAAGTYNRTLNLSLTYRPAFFSDEEARAFLALYSEEIRNYDFGVQEA
jgi:NRPS condensation-like uncharacterized protein